MSRIVIALMVAVLLFAGQDCASLPAEEPLPQRADVFVSGRDGYHTYRIPSLLVAADGTLLVFCEGRKANRSDDGDIDMLLRRSDDGGRTWAATQLVHEEGGDEPVKFGNPCPVLDEGTGAIVLVMNRSTGRSRAERQGAEVYVTVSRDHGATWSKPRDVTRQVKKPKWKAYAVGPGIGIQLKHGPHRGRLIVPANYRFTFSSRDPSYSHVIYSDDHGTTWKLGGIVGPHTNECQVAEINERGKPGLLMNMRNHWGRAGKAELSGKRLVARSFDGGETWSPAVADETLVEPACQASILRYAWKSDDSPGIILFSNPASDQRENLTIRASFDEGRTWPGARTIEKGAAAYSCLARLPDGRIGVVYECENYGKLTFAAVTLDWLRGKDDAANRRNAKPSAEGR